MGDAALVAVLRRDRGVILASLVALTGIAWAYTLHLAGNMGGAGAGSDVAAAMAPAFTPWSAADFTLTFIMWVVMMVGMMTPSAAPMILLYARVGRQADVDGRPFAAVGWFAVGYLLAWVGFSAAATLIQWGVIRAALVTPMVSSADIVFGAAVLIVAGVYELTPLKNACLRHCQAPLSFIFRHGGFRRDAGGSVGLGFRHGLYCVGCCWALMGVLFVVGVMNVLWIACLMIVVLVEKLAVVGRVVSAATGLGLIAWGVWLSALQPG